MGGKKRGKKGKEEKTIENSGHYVIASSRPPERRPLERRTLVPKVTFGWRRGSLGYIIVEHLCIVVLIQGYLVTLNREP